MPSSMTKHHLKGQPVRQAACQMALQILMRETCTCGKADKWLWCDGEGGGDNDSLKGQRLQGSGFPPLRGPSLYFPFSFNLCFSDFQHSEKISMYPTLQLMETYQISHSSHLKCLSKLIDKQVINLVSKSVNHAVMWGIPLDNKAWVLSGRQ